MLDLTHQSMLFPLCALHPFLCSVGSTSARGWLHALLNASEHAVFHCVLCVPFCAVRGQPQPEAGCMLYLTHQSMLFPTVCSASLSVQCRVNLSQRLAACLT